MNFGDAAAATPPWWGVSPERRPALSQPIDVDVLVVGGGLAGITLAWALATRESRVAVVEAGPIAGGATGRNAGLILAGPAEPYSELVAMYGRPGARAVLQIGRRNHEIIRRLVETLGLECGHRVSGSLRLARTEEEAEDQRASLPLLQEDGFRATEIAPADALAPWAAERFLAAFFDPDDGEVDPVAFVRGLAAAAATRGALLFEDSALRAARWGGDGWIAEAGRGTVRAGTLVIATNAHAPLLCPALEPLIRPRRGQMLSTAPIAEPVSRAPTYAHWGYQYWRQLPDGRLAMGGWRDLDLDGEVGYDDRPNDLIQRAIEGGLRDLVPGGAVVERRWAGIMGFARDGRPLVGWLDAAHHLAVCAGFTGHGMGMAVACAMDLADLLGFRAAPGIDTFAPSRFPELARSDERFLRVGAAADTTA